MSGRTTAASASSGDEVSLHGWRHWLHPGPRAVRAGEEAAKRPAYLLYGVEEYPPALVTVVLGVQHVFVISVGWIFVVVLVNGFGGTAAEAQSVIRLSMIASGVATILQAIPRGPVGSGYLCPFSCGPAYLSASILAGKAGGLPLIFGCTAISGVFEGLLARAMPKLRSLFPPEVTGLVVATVGLELIRLGCPRFVGYSSGHLNPRSVVTASIALAATVIPTVWSKSHLRLYPILSGLLAGYIASFAMGVLHRADIAAIAQVPLLQWPHRVAGGWQFRLVFVLPFLIASLSSALKTVGDLTLCEKINNANWKRTDMRPVAGGILSGAIGNILAALFGGAGQSTFSSNVGLSIATGATSRVIAMPIGLILIALAFLPKLAAVFSVMPQPVMGAVLVYVACFMILGGLQVLTSRMLDNRKTFVVGIALIFGLSVEMVPGLYENVPSIVRPLFASTLSLTTIAVVLLNLLFRVGIAKTRTLELSSDTNLLDSVQNLLEEQGAVWGMRKEVALRAADAIYETIVSLRSIGSDVPVTISLRFDEFRLDADVAYVGPQLNFPDSAPNLETAVTSPAALSGFMIRHYADRVSSTQDRGRSHIRLQFEH
jgi:xanthine permease XanP